MLRGLARVCKVDPAKDDHELLPAEAVHQLKRAQMLAQLIAGSAQNGVSAVMAVEVVDGLEVVDVAQQYAYRLARQPGLL